MSDPLAHAIIPSPVVSAGDLPISSCSVHFPTTVAEDCTVTSARRQRHACKSGPLKSSGNMNISRKIPA